MISTTTNIHQQESFWKRKRVVLHSLKVEDFLEAVLNLDKLLSSTWVIAIILVRQDHPPLYVISTFFSFHLPVIIVRLQRQKTSLPARSTKRLDEEALPFRTSMITDFRTARPLISLQSNTPPRMFCYMCGMCWHDWLIGVRVGHCWDSFSRARVSLFETPRGNAELATAQAGQAGQFVQSTEPFHFLGLAIGVC